MIARIKSQFINSPYMQLPVKTILLLLGIVILFYLAVSPLVLEPAQSYLGLSESYYVELLFKIGITFSFIISITDREFYMGLVIVAIIDLAYHRNLQGLDLVFFYAVYSSLRPLGVFYFWFKLLTKARDSVCFRTWLRDLEKLKEKEPSKAGTEFEKFVIEMMRSRGLNCIPASTWKERGYYPPSLLKGQGDGGLDFIGWDDHKIYLGEIKFTKVVKGDYIAKVLTMKSVFESYLRDRGETREIIPVFVGYGHFDNTATTYINHIRKEQRQDLYIVNKENIESFLDEVD